MPEKSEKVLPFNSHWATLSMAALLITAPIAAGSFANAAEYSFTQFRVPGAALMSTSGINDAEQIVGWYFKYDSTGNHGFLYTGGSFTQIDVPGTDLTL